MRKILLFPVASLTLAFAACGGADEDFERAVAIVSNPIPVGNVSEQVWPGGTITPEEGEHDCIIPSRPGTYVEGKCEWKVEEGGAGWLVTRIEKWKCADYNAIQGSSDFCTGEEGRHEWIFEVGDDGRAGILIERGDSPPEALK